ncbi:DUF488 domain-containing protein [Mesoplasma lactucae]|uniref:Uncharacterized protein n=1 Tax=Mesoplasma lactucae ATCC 49193 TaxID=81460 RepID=A0A291ISS2_9MOLU|nr:DUF488 family protein [Mesoplasma lactucae]ATG97737.1 hypothetical protein CP520_03305 [Mesoplasma lactucae ATCC 49193]ATZ20486.1 hypothetical protein MLACT_v1c06650 [Mesoplasma lactucae ATCC 49193]MCL8216657.1 hypothetical protein [Mesoplasma lactucae ATCC 49193]
MINPNNVKLKRAYEPADSSDGLRFLVDRLWPRGISKERADLTGGWLKDIAPSTELRKWFNHQPDRWDQFQVKYKEELKGSLEQQALNQLKEAAEKQVITLVYGAKDETENEAVVIRNVLIEK